MNKAKIEKNWIKFVCDHNLDRGQERERRFYHCLLPKESYLINGKANNNNNNNNNNCKSLNTKSTLIISREVAHGTLVIFQLKDNRPRNIKELCQKKTKRERRNCFKILDKKRKVQLTRQSTFPLIL